MKIHASNTTPFWRVLLLLAWLFIVGACIGHSMSSFFKIYTLRDISMPAYIVVLIGIMVFTSLTSVFLAKGLLTWLDK